MTTPRIARDQAGFSLLELLVAFAILATAATSLFLLGSTTAVGNTRSKEHAAAAALAVDKIEALRNTPFEEITSNADAGAVTAGGAAGGTFTRSWTVTDTTVSGVPAKNVTVTVNGPPGVTVALTTTVVDPPALATDYFEGFPTASVKSWSQQ